MDWATIRHVAHRCGGSLAPENTVEGLEVAAALGFRAVEFDVMLSADGTPFLIHDETLERTTDGHGRVAQTGDCELAGLFAKRGHEAAFPLARMPRFDAAIAACVRLGLAMNVEIKPAPGHEVATALAVAACLRALAGSRSRPLPLLSSFSPAALRTAGTLLPDLPVALLLGQVTDDWPLRVRECNCSGLHVAADQEDWGWLAAARAAGLAVRCYTVNDRAQARDLFARGVDAVFTDALDVFAADAVAVGQRRA